MNTEQTVMALVDAHVKASLEAFAGRPRDTAMTREAIAVALRSMMAANPLPALLRAEVPPITPPKAKRARIFGG